mgnify:CR=1 FL=1
MNGGTIQDNIANTASSDSSSPAVLLLGASTFTMNGGSICNNSGQCGTAVYLTASSNAAKARFTMNGGTLSNNESHLYTPYSTPTGAVFVKYSAEFVLNEGTNYRQLCNTAEPVAVWQLWMNCQGKNMALPLR